MNVPRTGSNEPPTDHLGTPGANPAKQSGPHRPGLEEESNGARATYAKAVNEAPLDFLRRSASTSENTHTPALAASEGIHKVDNAENRPYLGTVSLPSAVHHQENLGKKWDDMVNQPWGFSISPKAQQQQDVDAINQHINKWNDGQSVADSPVKHKPASDGKTEYSIEGRTYSTHSDTAQLYPISGPGISTGKGAGDMYHLLKQNNMLNKVNTIQIHQLHQGMQAQAYQEQAQNKIAGGHRSGVDLKKPQVTPAGNINKMKDHKLKPLLDGAKKGMDEVPPSPRFSNQLRASTQRKK